MTRDNSALHVQVSHTYGQVNFEMPLEDAVQFFATAFCLAKALQEQSAEQVASWHLPPSQDEFMAIRNALLSEKLRR